MGMPLHDLNGHRFGMLIVTARAINGGPKVRWICNCDCGKSSEVAAGDLRNGKTGSCGCLNTKTGRKLRKLVKRTFLYQKRAALTVKFRREYNSWFCMLARCENPNDSKYHLYGGRGISVCERWKEFPTFLQDMGKRPTKKTLDRINTSGNYEPTNCRWATSKEQQKNRRCTRFVTNENGHSIPIKEFAKSHGIPANLIAYHIDAGHNIFNCIEVLKSKTGYRISRGACSNEKTRS